MRYPLLLQPILKDYLWGGKRLQQEFGFDNDRSVTAEAWMLSCHPDGTSLVRNGMYAGQRLDDVLRTWGENDTDFPLLVKLIDAADRLSVQVHPDDAYAARVEQSYGKTEMWYVVDCEPGAELAYGFVRTLAEGEFRQRIENNTLEEVIRFVPVKPGDVFLIEAGTLHAIGKGILIAEIQQNSNVTYRVSDYGRLGADGKPRALHVEKALAVTKTEPPTIPYGAIGEKTVYPYGVCRKLAECAYFTVEHLQLDGTYPLPTPQKGRFLSVLALDGDFTATYENEKIFAKKGDSLYVPSDCSVVLSGTASLLCSQP